MDYANITTGTGGRVLPSNLEYQRVLAEHIGFVVMKAAQLDGTMAALVDIIAGFHTDLKLEAWGRSGSDLTDRLRRIEGVAPETAGFADRYKALYEHRNQVVHSLRMDDEDGDLTHRMLKQNPKKPSEGIYASARVGIPELIDLWYDLNELSHEVMVLFLDFAARSKWMPQ